MKEAKKYFLLVCVLFAAATFCSSVIQLGVQGKEFDSNTHILARAAICLLGAGFFYLFRVIKLKNHLLEELVHYVVSLALILLSVHCLGFFIEIGEKPPYPRFTLNYTGVYIVVAIVVYLKERKKKKEGSTYE